jgi:hypothetical protein
VVAEGRESKDFDAAVDAAMLEEMAEAAEAELSMTPAQQQQEMRENEDEHDATMLQAYGRKFP